MIEALHGVKVQRSHAVAQHVLLIHRLERGRPIIGVVRIEGGQPIGLQRPRRRREDDLLVELAIPLVRDDGRALGDVGAEPARMIEVVVRAHHVPNGLVGNQLVDFADDRQRPVLVQRRLDHDRVVAEIDCHAVVSPTGDEPHAVGQLLRLDANRWNRGLPHRVRNRDRRNGQVRLDVGHLDLAGVMARIQSRLSLVDVDERGELHASEILVVGVSEVVQHVAHDGIGYPCLDHFDEILIVDHPVHSVLPERGKRDHGCFSSALRHAGCRRSSDRGGDRCGVAGQGPLEEAVRGEPDFELPHFGCGRRRDRVVRLHVPGGGAADDEHLLLFALERRSAAAARWIGPLPARELLPRRLGVVVDGLGVLGHLEPRPVIVRAVALTDGRGHPGSGNLDGFQVVGAHRPGGGLQDRPRILRGRGPDHHGQTHHCHARNESQESFCHYLASFSGYSRVQTQCGDRL